MATIAGVTGFPFPLEAVPGELQVLLDQFEGRGHRYWTYLTQGMLRHGQEELIFVLEAVPGEEVPAQPVALFQDIFEFARQGKPVSVGGRTLLGDSLFLGRRDLTGLAYLPVPEILPVPSTTLLVVALLGDEARVMEQHGILRVLAHLGRAERYFPFPWWFERSRQARLKWKQVAPSLLGKIPTASYWRATVLKREDPTRIELRLPRSLQARFQVELSPLEAFALKTGWSEAANAILVWQVNQDGPEAINVEGTQADSMAGCFLLACRNPEEKNEMRIVEDGFTMLLDTQSMEAFRKALREGQELSLDCPDLPLSILWLEEP